ncbi:pyridoxal phosphate-dependent aminotransferase [Piscinibacter sp. Jin2]|uniref:alanine transaminase n=1 Tax=Aquariibacter lacus TaxID=2801332 RepID=A0A9X1BQJ5_9BURK|nr:pyridoxal phosphate-dependent aminotransferase [Piscinibacter lacus]
MGRGFRRGGAGLHGAIHRVGARIHPSIKILAFALRKRPRQGACAGPTLTHCGAPVSKPIHKSSKLANVCYDIRGPVLDKARQMEEDGHKIIKLNIGNLAVFGFDAPDEIVQDMIRNLPSAAGYTDSKGLFAPRRAVVHYTQEKGITGVTVDDVYLGNGASELIAMSMNALLDAGDEVLVPAPDYPLWTASVSLSGGTPVHYLCDEGAEWYPDLDDIRRKITPATRAIVIINPNNPTGALYPEPLLRELVEIARQHKLIVFADEIYDKTLYDGNVHTSIASLADDVFFVTFNGLSKNYRACGYRAGWMVVSGNKRQGRDYIEGLNMLASMRLCANTPGQLAVQTALGGYQSIKDLVAPQGRLTRQRDLAYERMSAIPGVSVVKPKAALYMFPRLDPKVYPIQDDQQFAYELLAEEKVLIVQGTGFNWTQPDHFRLVFLPNTDDLGQALDRIERFLAGYRKRHSV